LGSTDLVKYDKAIGLDKHYKDKVLFGGEQNGYNKDKEKLWEERQDFQD
jgi:hypothetical protein